MDKLSQQVQIIGISSVFLLMVAAGIILLVFVYQKRQLVYIREKEQLKDDFEKQILQSKLEIQEQTFKNISQEIHDNIGQVLSLAKLTINTMSIGETDKLPEKIESSKKLVSKAIEDLRNLSRNLNTEYITDLGLTVSIENEIKLLKNASNYQVDTIVNGELYRLQHQQELIIFRIFQEVLQNIIKHSQASLVVISFLYDPDIFSLQVKDNGIGFDVEKLDQKENSAVGIGVRNMRYRSNMIGAEFTINSAPGKGTMIEIMLPLNSTTNGQDDKDSAG